MPTYAQTNIQLFNQLQREKYCADDLKAVFSAYELAASLMTGRFRASGKTFIAHLVGTASILASLKAPGSLVVAGLLHAAYPAGDFGDGRPGVSAAKRERVRSVIGEQAEEYVRRYDSLGWTDQTVRSVLFGLENMSPIDRDVVLMRLANELEEFLDLGVHYCGEQRRLGSSAGGRCRLMVELAGRLGYPNLAEEMARIIEESASATVAPELLAPHARNSSFLVAPESLQRLKDSLASRLAVLKRPNRDQPNEP
jgi:(p)ppGpp synthase/HD superfamily hydrolase